MKRDEALGVLRGVATASSRRLRGSISAATTASSRSRSPATVVVDRTHLGRRASGIERVTAELFSNEALRPLPAEGFGEKAIGNLATVATQMVGAPLAMAARPRTAWVFSGYPPSPVVLAYRERAIMYVHDMFLLTRRQDLNAAGRLYMAPSFRYAVERLRYFLVNSRTTGDALAPYVRPDAKIRLYRPSVRNVFDLAPTSRRRLDGAPLILGAIGTVEPRKNFLSSAAVAFELERRLGRRVELHIVGRDGWGEERTALAASPNVKLHGFLPDAEARQVISGFDALLCTSHDEGLGLPLIEAQYGGRQVIAPQRPVFREVLGKSGLYIDPDDPAAAAATIAVWLAQEGWRERATVAALSNVSRWNALAAGDRQEVIDMLADRLAYADEGPPHDPTSGAGRRAKPRDSFWPRCDEAESSK